MKELFCNVWQFEDSPNVFICITTNGFVKKKSHECVMGKGIAKEASNKYQYIKKILGESILKNGNIFQPIINNLFAFPVKHNWFENADIDLIINSAKSLSELANKNSENIYLLPRPGCGNGNLDWEFVKPHIESLLPDNVIIVTNKKGD